MNNEKKHRDEEITYISIDDLLKVDAADVTGGHVPGKRKGSAAGGSRSRKRRRRAGKGIRTAAVCAGIFFTVLFAGAGVVMAKWSAADRLSAGMFKNKSNAETVPEAVRQSLDDQSTERDRISLPDTYTISYKGKTYAYNDNLVNILIMGIDNKGDSQEEAVVPHQADSLVLAVMDVVKKKLSFINIPRDTVTQLQVLDLNNDYVRTIYGPIAIQHSYGDEKAGSSEATVNTVSNLLYSTPVYRYAAIDMAAVALVNDAVGGVTVDILEDLTKWNPSMKQGVTYELMGKDATIYVCRRDTDKDDSAIGRMKRQSQYLKALFEKGKERTKENILFPVTVYMDINDKIETNLTTDEITYLARQVIEMDLNADRIKTIPGEMKHIQKEMYEGYEYPMGYVLDEEELKELVIETFYYEVQ